jgi:uncharacterized membrane protein
MTLLILGLIVWSAAHFFKRAAPGPRERLGNGGKALVAGASFVALALMIWGYRGADFVPLWTPPAWATHVNNLLMVFAVYLFAADGVRAWITRRVRHPQLTAVLVWAVAHLLVNGDLAALVLFGGLFVWALAEILVLNRIAPDWTPRPLGRGAEAKAIAGTVIATAAIMGIHAWLGVVPWG